MLDKETLSLVKQLVEKANSVMNGLWDTKMYHQKDAIIKILKDK